MKKLLALFALLIPIFPCFAMDQGLHVPHWLALTPEGDILLTETREHQILRLHTGDKPDAAKQINVFGGKENGIDNGFFPALFFPRQQ